jgi:hypothetical protein
VNLEQYDAAIDAARAPNEERVVLVSRSAFSDALVVVKAVITVYNQVAFLPELVAMDIDPAPVSRSMRKSQESIDYTADVSSALRRFLVTRNDRVQMRAAWNTLLLEDDSKIKDRERRLILCLAKIFQKNGLEPAKYFAPRIRRKSPWL